MMENSQPTTSEPKKGTEKKSKSKPIPNDIIHHTIGEFGKYQWLLLIFIGYCKIPVGMHQMAIIFLAPEAHFTCNGKIDHCPCPNPEFNRTIHHNTIVMQWNLICERSYLASLEQTLFQFGALSGSIIFGMASDRYGRRSTLLISTTTEILIGIIAAFMNNYWAFTILRFLLGFVIGGSMVVSFVLIMEVTGTQYRELVSALYHIPFNLGHLMLPLFAYFIRTYNIFQLTISIPAILMLSYYWFVPESPRWLMATNQTDKAVTVLEHIGKVNHLPTENIRADVEHYESVISANTVKRGTIRDLFNTRHIRINNLIMSFIWLSSSTCFYGVSQFIGFLEGNEYINVAFSASLTLLGTISAIFILKLAGRKPLVIIFNIICGACLIVLAIVQKGTASVILGSICVVSSFIVFIISYLYCSELFPTVVRNAAIGFSSMMARVGSMVAPFILDLREHEWLPSIIFALMPLISACLTCFLPETKDCELMSTIGEVEDFDTEQDKRRISLLIHPSKKKDAVPTTQAPNK